MSEGGGGGGGVQCVVCAWIHVYVFREGWDVAGVPDAS